MVPTGPPHWFTAPQAMPHDIQTQFDGSNDPYLRCGELGKPLYVDEGWEFSPPSHDDWTGCPTAPVDHNYHQQPSFGHEQPLSDHTYLSPFPIHGQQGGTFTANDDVQLQRAYPYDSTVPTFRHDGPTHAHPSLLEKQNTQSTEVLYSLPQDHNATPARPVPDWSSSALPDQCYQHLVASRTEGDSQVYEGGGSPRLYPAPHVANGGRLTKLTLSSGRRPHVAKAFRISPRAPSSGSPSTGVKKTKAARSPEAKSQNSSQQVPKSRVDATLAVIGQLAGQSSWFGPVNKNLPKVSSTAANSFCLWAREEC